MRGLRLLVTALMVVLIGGMLIVVAAMVIRLGVFGLPERTEFGPVSAAGFTLPAGAEAVALGRGPGEVLILTRDAAGVETLRVFDAASGAEKSAAPISRR